MSPFSSIRRAVFGRARSLTDKDLFHKLSLIALFAWVGLGADGLSSSCYGPEETFRALGTNHHLALFVALASVVTIVAICASYSQIIGLFPSGGGGYVVASKLLSPAAGVVSGSALLIDYVLTIAISVASGADALFSLPFLPPGALAWKLSFAVAGVIALTAVNLRGIRESVLIWVPAFFLFVATHAFAIAFAVATHAGGIGAVAAATAAEARGVTADVGVFGLLALLLKAYSMGAGTYTGIEAVSNGLPILREPRVRTGRRTMVYMGASLAITVAGLLTAYLLYHVEPVPGRTLNAVLFEKIGAAWSKPASGAFSFAALASEALILLIAAQAGFLDGPRVLANMAADRWLPTPFANLSERFVAQNGVLVMGGAALAVLWLTGGSVATLVVLYSINVFITFSLSQLGMVVHWWKIRRTEPAWRRRLLVNGFGLVLTSFILVSLTLVKFAEGGWITLLLTGATVAMAFAIRRHYSRVADRLRRLDVIVEAVTSSPGTRGPVLPEGERTAVILVNGFNGLGLHTALQVPRIYGPGFRRLVFLQVGVVDAGNFKGADDLQALRDHTEAGLARYTAWARTRGYQGEAFAAVGQDAIGEIMQLARSTAKRFPGSLFFAGQLLFARDTWFNRALHNSTAFTLQRHFFLENIPFMLLPIRIDDGKSIPA